PERRRKRARGIHPAHRHVHDRLRLLRRGARLEWRNQHLQHQPVHPMMRIAIYILVATAACASSVAPDPGLESLAVPKVAPGTIVPGTKIVVKGSSFVDEKWGAATLHLSGKAGGQSVDLAWPAKFVDFNTLTVAVDAGKIDALGGDVDFDGSVAIDFVAVSDG